jgi:hypothetical protein
MKNIYLFFLLTLAVFANSLIAQEMLANPSFEITDPGSNMFAGWNQIGEVSIGDSAWHGNLAAKAHGIINSEWNVSGFWQNLNCEPTEQWEISGVVRHSANLPLTGNSTAIINIEWYNAASQQIDYQSFTVADNSAPVEVFTEFNLLSPPAPNGTVFTHLLLGISQSPDEPAADVSFDQITFYSTTPPTIDDVQWGDFPAGRTLEFADLLWRVKGSGWYGPGPSNFNHSSECVWIDEYNRLHLTIKNIDDVWFSTEVTLEEALGYGDYIFTTCGDLDHLDIHTVLGLFIWQYNVDYDPAQNWWNPYNEIDVEFSYWGNPANEIGQFVAQPWDWQGNLIRFEAEFAEDEISSHAFNWQPDRVEFRSWFGDSEDEAPENMIFQWTYTGPHIPRPEQPRVHINLWQFAGPPATEQEVVIEDFTFYSFNTAAEPDLIPETNTIIKNYPNPFNPQTKIIYQLKEPQNVKIEVYNIKGQKVIELVNEVKKAGSNECIWNAKNHASGIYFIRLTTPDNSQTQKALLLK